MNSIKLESIPHVLWAFSTLICATNHILGFFKIILEMLLMTWGMSISVWVFTYAESQSATSPMLSSSNCDRSTNSGYDAFFNGAKQIFTFLPVTKSQVAVPLLLQYVVFSGCVQSRVVISASEHKDAIFVSSISAHMNTEIAYESVMSKSYIFKWTLKYCV